MIISHKIELIPNNKAKSYFRQAFGCARLAYNWGLGKYLEYYRQGISKSHLDLKTEFNAIKKEKFPFVYNVSKYVTQQPFFYLNEAFAKFFRDLKQGKVSHPRFKKKRENSGTFYIGGDKIFLRERPRVNGRKRERDDDLQDTKAVYLKVPKLGYVKMREPLRFEGKINHVTISQDGDKFYAGFNLVVSSQEYEKTHKLNKNAKHGVAVNTGLKSAISLSNGLKIETPKLLDKLNALLVKQSKRLAKKQHPKTKGEANKGIKKSANYVKAAKKLNKLKQRAANIRNDYLQKLTSFLVRNFSCFALENSKVGSRIYQLANGSRAGFYEFRKMLVYKVIYNNRQIVVADKNYSSENLCQLISEKIGQVLPEFTPADLTALLDDLATNQLVTSKVETGMQRKSRK